MTCTCDVSVAEFQEQLTKGVQVGVLMDQLCDYIKSLSLKPVENYNSADVHFVRVSLKPLLSFLLARPDENEADSLARRRLFEEMTKLAVATNLNSYILFAVFCFFSDAKALPNIVTNVVMTREQRESVLTHNTTTIVKDPDSSPVQSMIQAIYGGPMFTTARNMIQNKTMNLNQITSLVRLFGVTEPFMVDNFAVAVAGYYIEYAMAIFKEQDVDSPTVPHLMRFIVTFPEMLRDQWKDILTFIFGICERTERHSEVVVQFLALFVKVVVNNEDVVSILKKEFFELVRKVKKKSMLSEIYEMLTTIFTRIGVSVNDLTMLLYHAQTMREECGLCILKMLPRVLESVDDLCCRALAFGVFCPSLHMALIDRCDDEAIGHALFLQLIECDRWSCDSCVTQTKLSDRMISFLQKEIDRLTDEHHATNIAWILSKFPKMDVIHDYLVRVFSMKTVSDRMVEALKNLCLVFTKMENEKIVSYVITSVIDVLLGTSSSERKAKFADVGVFWLLTLNPVPESHIFQKLMSINYSKSPSDLHPIISTLLMRSLNRRGSRSLLVKMMKDTVAPEHANWAINLAFTLAHDDKKEFDKLADQLLQSLGDDTKRNNVIHMIYWGVLRECDFYRIGDRFGFVQNVIVDGREIAVSLHPCHSARRIYAEAAAAMNRPISKFLLVNSDGMTLDMNGPLTAVRLSRTQPLVYHLVPCEANGEEICVVAHFMDYLGQQEHFNVLFNQMNSFSPENELLFQILTLFPCSIQTGLVTPIQLMFRGDFIISFEYVDSIRVFPFVVERTLGCHQSLSTDFVEQFFKVLTQQQYDDVSLAIMCDSIVKCGQKFEFDVRMTKLCLIDSPSLLIREAFVEMMAENVNQKLLLSILHLTAVEQNRSNTKQFFDLLAKAKVPSEMVLPFFEDMPRFEKSIDSGVDETYIGMLSLLEPSEHVMKLVFQRLFSHPTCYSVSEPFLHSLKARRAALKFLEKGNYMEHFYRVVTEIPMISPWYSKVSDDLGLSRRNVVVGNSLVHCFFQVLSSIWPFTQAMISTEFKHEYLRQLGYFFAEMEYGVSGHVEGYDFRIESRNLSEIIATLFDYINCELGSTASVTTLFQGVCEERPFYSISIDSSKYQCLGDVPMEISHWPQYLLLSIHHEGGRKSEFQFPLVYQPKETEQYKACAMITQGIERNFSTITLSKADNQWFLRSGNEMRYFDIGEYANWCFGRDCDMDSSVIFIVYQKSSVVDDGPIRILPEIEHFVNQKNAMSWPFVVCASDHFIEFVQNSTTDVRLNDPQYLNFVFQMLTKVVVFSETWMSKWSEWFSEVVVADHLRATQFNDYIWTEINKNVVELASVSEAASRELPKIICASNRNAGGSVEDARRMIECLDFSVNSRQFGFVCDVISGILKMEIDWTSESELFKSILDALTHGRESCDISLIFDRILLAFDSFMSVVLHILKERAYNETLSFVFTVEFLEMWLDCEEQSSVFAEVIKRVNTKNSEVFSRITGLSPGVEKLLQEIVVLHKPINVVDLRFLPFEKFAPVFESILFSDNLNLRAKLLNTTTQLLPKPHTDIIRYIECAWITNITCPALGSESCWSQSFLTFMPTALRVMSTNPDQCTEYLKLLEILTLLAPISLSLCFPEVLEMFALCDVKSPLAFIILNIMHHLLIIDPSLVSSLTPEHVNKILESRYGGRYGVQLLRILGNGSFSVHESELSGACVEYGLSNIYGDDTETLVEMIVQDLVPGQFVIPNSAPDLLCLKLANALWTKLPKLRDKLRKYIATSVRTAVPVELFKQSPCIRESMSLVGKTK